MQMKFDIRQRCQHQRHRRRARHVHLRREADALWIGAGAAIAEFERGVEELENAARFHQVGIVALAGAALHGMRRPCGKDAVEIAGAHAEQIKQGDGTQSSGPSVGLGSIPVVASNSVFQMLWVSVATKELAVAMSVTRTESGNS